ncbi:MAG: DUF1780 domain-containing protein [Pseudomonadales bacterium]|nr:DUF1780 domain-containing protein [Pseudomonadales bacterium]
MHPSDTYLDEIRRHLEESVAFWANGNKAERERSVVRAFLRCLGVTFTEPDVLANQPEPVDVAALDARFQVTEVLDLDRKRHEEYRRRLERAQEAESPSDLREPWTNPMPIHSNELVQRVSDRLSAKVPHRDIDALVYLNLRDRFLSPDYQTAVGLSLCSLGWRSVSVLAIPYALVMHAHADTPSLILDNVGVLRMKWGRPDGWFEAGA